MYEKYVRETKIVDRDEAQERKEILLSIIKISWMS